MVAVSKLLERNRLMKSYVFSTMALLLAGLTQAATVEVDFVQPDKFADIGRGPEGQATLAALTKHLKSLGEQALPAQQVLKISVTDVDLAGQQPQMNARGSDLRVMGKGADWPRINLRYKLTDGDKVVAEGEAKLTDMNYLDRKTAQRPNEPLPYETRMLTNWFNSQFRPAAKR
jgi:hypothetical protein